MVAENEDDRDGGERDALQSLVASEGWKRFEQHIDAEWGAEACMVQIDRALTELRPGDEDGERMTVLQIRSAARRIRALQRWPHERIAALSVETKKSGRPFDALRRIGR